MIRNERQYRVTLGERDRLLGELDRAGAEETPVWVADATRSALTSQVLDLDVELSDYELLRSGAAVGVSEVTELSDLPRALVRSRIAAGLTQKELGERLGLREQQIQRYEANDYSGASIGRLEEVMRALGVKFRGELALPSSASSAEALRRNLSELGIGGQTQQRRFFGTSGEAGGLGGWMNAAARAARIFKADIEEAVAGQIPTLSNAGAFRASRASNATQIGGYARYAEYMAQLLVQACIPEFRPLPQLEDLRSQLGSRNAAHPLEGLARICWEHGIPVLPLSDRGTFYGACWQISGRPAIALKNQTRTTDRWAFLLGHEMYHAANPDDHAVLEQELTASEWKELPTERSADEFATQVLLGESAEAMLHVAVEQAGGDVARLKDSLPAVAAAGGVPPGILADYAANRIGSQGINWWPTANRLHSADHDPWAVCRSILFEYVDLSRLDRLDREIFVDGISL